MDPEAGTFVAYGEDLDARRELGALLHAAFHNHKALEKLVATVPFEYD